MSGSDTPQVGEGAMGHGYARHSRVQHRAADHGMPLLRRALETMAVPRDGSPFRVADLGAAAGTNSLAPLRAVVEGVRARTGARTPDRKSTRLNSSHVKISYAVFRLKTK